MMWWLLLFGLMLGAVLALSAAKGASASHSNGSHGSGHGGKGSHGSSLEQKVNSANRNLPSSAQTKPEAGSSYSQLKAETEGPRAIAQSYSPKTGGSSAAVSNVARNMPVNLFDNTAGYFIAKYQNMKSRQELAKNPGKPIAYLMHGAMQNQGSQWRLAREARKQGMVPYHLSGRHSLSSKLSTEKKVDETYAQIDKLHKSVGITNPSSRSDVFSGHSSGGNRAIEMAKDERTLQYGIKSYQARAPNPMSTEPQNIWQKLIMGLVPGENAKTPAGKVRAVEMMQGTPRAPVHVVAGEYDRLVPAPDTLYPKAASSSIIRGPDSSHFGTSGGNSQINGQLVSQLYNIMNAPKPYRQDRKSYKIAA